MTDWMMDQAMQCDPAHGAYAPPPARAPIRDLAAVREFVLAGRARFTVVSKKTGARKTFRARANREAGRNVATLWFVDLLTGQSNETDYRYVGFFKQTNDGSLVYGHNKKGFAVEAGDVLRWLVRFVNRAGDLERQAAFAEMCEVWHEGRCGRCGRALTDPASIERGIGPVCDGKEA